MRRRTRMAALVALVAAVFVSTWGVGTSGAQEHHGDHHGGHGGHDSTTTTQATTTTTQPGSTTTTPPGSTTTTQPGSTTTTTQPGSTTTTVPSQPGAEQSEIRYGPFTIPGAPDNPDGTHGHAHTGNQFRFFIEKPCTNCYVTSMQADLVYADGRRAGYSTNAQLHHMVLASWTNRQDATCYFGFPFPLGLIFGQRFFASGDERTLIRMPPGFGYRVDALDTWNLIYELANMQAEPQDVFIEMSYEWVPASTPGMSNVEPVWFDVAQCGFSEISRPAGRSQASWTWNVNRPGGIMAIGGHIHDGGENIVIRNDSTGELICDSRAGYGESPLYIDHHGEGHISSMSACFGRRGSPVARVENGQRVTMTANYDMPEAVDDQMGIVMAFVAADE